MMSEVTRIVDQVKRAFYGEAWHGPSLMGVLKGVTAKQAATRPTANAHSIWEIVLHLTTWIEAVHKRTSGEKIEVPDEMDWPLVKDSSESAWNQTLNELGEVHQNLEQHLATLTDADLGKLGAGSQSTIYRLLHGTIQHNLYHAGQVALLKKFVSL